MNFEVTCFKMSFTICILKICDFYLNSKYFCNQNIWQDSRNFGEFLWYMTSRKSFFELGQISKNDKDYQNLQILNNEIANWEQITKSHWLRSVSERSLAPFFWNSTVYLCNNSKNWKSSFFKYKNLQVFKLSETCWGNLEKYLRILHNFTKKSNEQFIFCIIFQFLPWNRPPHLAAQLNSLSYYAK